MNITISFFNASNTKTNSVVMNCEGKQTMSEVITSAKTYATEGDTYMKLSIGKNDTSTAIKVR